MKAYLLSNGDGLLLVGGTGFIVAIGVGEKVIKVVDDSDVERAAWAASDLFADAELVLGDLEEVPARTWIRVRLQLLVPLHVLNLYVVIRHRFAS